MEQTHRNVLVFEHKDFKISAPRSKKFRAMSPDMTHINIEEVGRRLIWSVDGVRLIPPGFARLAPKLAANQTLAELADLLGAQSDPVSRDDAVAVERDIIHILRLMGPMAAFKHLKSNSKDHSLLSPLEVLEAAYRDWKAYLETFEMPRLLPPEEN